MYIYIMGSQFILKGDTKFYNFSKCVVSWDKTKYLLFHYSLKTDVINAEGENDQPEQIEEYDNYGVVDTVNQISVNDNNKEMEEAASPFNLPTFEVKLWNSFYWLYKRPRLDGLHRYCVKSITFLIY